MFFFNGKEITVKSIQSPYDTECDFRIKTEKKTKGYDHNITETCDSENVVNLITDIQTAPATQADNEFLEPSIKKSRKILTDKIENSHSDGDGAYNGEANQTFTKEENINFFLTVFQGSTGRYDLTIKNDNIQIVDTKTNTQTPVTLTKNNKYRIKTKTAYRYFTDKQIESCYLRKQVEQLPKEKKTNATMLRLLFFNYLITYEKIKLNTGAFLK